MESAAKKPFLQKRREEVVEETAPVQYAVNTHPALEPVIPPHRELHLVEPVTKPHSPIDRPRGPQGWFAVFWRNTVSALSGRPRAKTRKRRARIRRRIAHFFLRRNGRA